MRLHLDGIIFSLQQHGGITVYFKELLRRFNETDQAVLTIESPLHQSIAAKSFPNVCYIERQSRLLERVRECRSIKDFRPEVFHSSYYRTSAQRSVPTVVTVHDFVAHRFLRDAKGRMRRWLINNSIKQAQHIICISESTRQDLLEFVPLRANQRVSVIYNGVSDLFAPLSDSNEATPGANQDFALFVGQRGGYKNFSLALRALEYLPDLLLYCVGGGHLQPPELACVPENIRSRIRHLGFVDDTKLNFLYNQAHCLIYPSAYEGFGIPVLEAMRAGCPVVSVDCNAVVEIGGQALSLSEDASDPRSLANAVERLYDSKTRESIKTLGLTRSQEFSWDQCFKQTISTYNLLR